MIGNREFGQKRQSLDTFYQPVFFIPVGAGMPPTSAAAESGPRS
jgi:hypothetical protein